MALNTLAIRKLTRPGRYADGGRSGLYLKVGMGGGRSWQFRYQRGAKTTWLGLGPERDISLAEARDLARDCRRQLLAGIDPLADKREKQRETKAAHTALIFRAVADLYVGAHETSWRSDAHRDQWRATLRDYILPVLGDSEVAAVDTGAVMRVLEPIWPIKPETASRVRGRIEAILDYAKARGWRTGENAARWKGHLDQLLPRKGKIARVEHHPALPWSDIGEFMGELARINSLAASTVRFLILTATRSGETRGARWSEFNIEHRTWAIPASRMKAGREHRVPLSDAALNILREMSALRRGDDSFVFPGQRPGRPLSDRALAKLLHRKGHDDITVHGFRSTFRDWAGETTAYPREVIEMALAHRLGDAAEQAYARGDLIEKRRRLMAEWATFCSRPIVAGDVVSLRAVG